MMTLHIPKPDWKMLLKQYSWLTHALLVAWTTFISTWATGVSVPLWGYQFNARNFVSWLQHNGHIPTWVPLLVTIFFNVYLLYRNMRTPDAKLMEARKVKLARYHSESAGE